MAGSARADQSGPAPAPVAVAAPASAAASTPASAPRERIAGTVPPAARDFRITAPAAANDTGPGQSGSNSRETRIIAAAAGAAGGVAGRPSLDNRARGIGSRFRAARPGVSEKA